MIKSMANISNLLNNLRTNHWHMTSFLFKYKNSEYVVLFEDIANLKIKDEGYKVLLTFIDTMDVSRTLAVKANDYSFKFNVKEFRLFFNIEYSNNLGDVFQQFYQYFNRFIPTQVNPAPTRLEQKLVINRLNKNDNDNNTCCFSVKRNPYVDGKQHFRTPFNSDKCRRLKADLYYHFENDNTISFCFREFNELSTSEILKNFAALEEKNALNRQG